MNYENEKQQYCEAMEQIHAPESLKRKVLDMREKKKMKWPVKLAWAAGIIAGVFVASNAVSYAATGETWVETVTVYINGMAINAEAETTTWTEGDTTFTTYTFEAEEEGSEVMMTIITDEPGKTEFIINDGYVE